MSEIEFSKFELSEPLVRVMLGLIEESRFRYLEYGTLLCKKGTRVFPSGSICKGDECSVSVSGKCKDYAGRFHTHRESFNESPEDYLGVLEGLLDFKERIECIYGPKENAVKCTHYACNPEQCAWIEAQLPKVKSEEIFKAKFLDLLRKLTIDTKVYTIKELEAADELHRK